MLKALFSFYKIGIVNFVVITAAVGYGVGLQVEDPFSWIHFLLFLLGTFFISSGSLSLNQLQELDADSKMPRTQERPVVSGVISPQLGLTISLGHILLGCFCLYSVSIESLLVGLSIIFLYNVLYTIYWKRKWAFAAVPGAIPGALPVNMGYMATSNGSILDRESIYLFLVMFLWQMPHFWTLAIKYKDDYAKGEFPVLPVVVGDDGTKVHIAQYTILYAFTALMSPFFVPVYYMYYFVVIPFAIVVVWQFFKFQKSDKPKAWLPFFLWTNFSMLAFIIAPYIDKWTPLWFDIK
jgi:protoheme IX farnesyltransferase